MCRYSEDLYLWGFCTISAALRLRKGQKSYRSETSRAYFRLGMRLSAWLLFQLSSQGFNAGRIGWKASSGRASRSVTSLACRRAALLADRAGIGELAGERDRTFLRWKEDDLEEIAHPSRR